MNTGTLSWEEAVCWLRNQPDQETLVRACYYDDPLLDAAQRFASSDEWKETLALMPPSPSLALDLGAGRGIASYALARAGWNVTALEPDPSSIVGSNAIRSLSKEAGLPIRVIEEYGEKLPFGDSTFDVVYGRQVLHHARDLGLLCQEAARVLTPGGCFIATREHVISKRDDLQVFLESHPLQKFYGGENAFQLIEYTRAISQSGLHLRQVLGPFDSVINYFPTTREQLQAYCRNAIGSWISRPIAELLLRDTHPLGRWLLGRLLHQLSRSNHTPGRLYSFVAEKS